MHTTTPDKPKKVTAAKLKETAAKSKETAAKSKETAAKSKETAAKSTKKKAHHTNMSVANKRMCDEVLKTVPFTQVNGGKFMHAL